VYGVGAGLDTARYRGLLGAAYGVPASRVSGDVIGEHGDAAVCCLSTTRVDGQLVDADDPRTRRALDAFHRRPTMIRSGVGRVRAGAAGAVLSALRATVGGVDGIEHLSTRYSDLGAWLGQPIMFTAGRGRVRLPELTDVEQKSVDDASHKLVEAYASLRF
jgi:L-lactate dehydrogenase